MNTVGPYWADRYCGKGVSNVSENESEPVKLKRCKLLVKMAQ